LADWHNHSAICLTKNGLLASDLHGDFRGGAHFIASAPGRWKP